MAHQLLVPPSLGGSGTPIIQAYGFKDQVPPLPVKPQVTRSAGLLALGNNLEVTPHTHTHTSSILDLH